MAPERLAWLRAFGHEPPAPVYAFVGPDDGIAGEGLRRLRARLLPSEADRELGFTRHTGPGALAEALQVARRAPFGSSWRLLWVELEGEEGALAPEEERDLVRYAQAPSARSVLMLRLRQLPAGRLAARLRAAGRVCECVAPYPREVAQLAREMADELRLALEPGVADDLAHLVGADVGLLWTELTKMRDYAYPEARVRRADVRAVGYEARRLRVFDLVEAAGNGDEARALVLARDLLAHGEAAVGLLGLLAREARLLVRAAELRAEARGNGPSEGDLAARLGVPPFVVRRLSRQVAGRGPEAFVPLFDLLVRADRAIKRGMDEGVVLDRVVHELCARMRALGGAAG